MESRHYQFKVTSPWLWLFTLVSGFSFFGILVYQLKTLYPEVSLAIKDWELVFSTFTFCLILGIVNAVNRMIAGKINVWQHDDIVELKWNRQILFHHKSDFVFRLSEIRSYHFSDDIFPFFKLLLKDGKNLQFLYLTAKRVDYYNFTGALQQAIQDYNYQNPAYPIEKWESFLRKKTGLVTGIVLLLSFAAMPYAMHHVPASSPALRIAISVFYFCAAALILKVSYAWITKTRGKRINAIG